MSKVFRDESPLTLVNGTEQMTWYPRRMDLPPLEPVDCASEGGTFREPAPARVPRHRPLFKTDEQMRADGWEPASDRESADVGISMFVGAVALVLGCYGLAHLIVAMVRAAP